MSSSTSAQPSSKVLLRAYRAVGCSPFRMKLLEEMRSRSIPLSAISDDSGMLNGYTRQPLPEIAAEKHLLWLMAVGIVRREVDGQGLTDSFRLTPIGRQVIERWENLGRPDSVGSLLDYLLNIKNRWFRLPTWLQ